jgi:hypothetical protein
MNVTFFLQEPVSQARRHPENAQSEVTTKPAPRPAPRWREIALAVVVYAAYTVTRGLTDGNVEDADEIGRALLRWENSWHLAPEQTLNRLLRHTPALAVAFCYFYATLHYLLTPAVLVWVYRRHPDRYRAARTTLLVATVLGLVGFWLLPVTPPRLLPGGGFHDTLADVSGWGWWGGQASAPRGLGDLTNQYAAMPSLHVGWALWAGWLLARHARRRAVRVAGLLYPVVTTVVVMATANHYLLDAAGGVAVMALAAGITAGITARITTGTATLLARPARPPRVIPPPAPAAERQGLSEPYRCGKIEPRRCWTSP